MAHALPRGIGEQIARREKQNRCAERRRADNDQRPRPASEQKSDGEREQDGNGQAERRRRGVEKERDQWGGCPVRIDERAQRITMALDRFDVDVVVPTQCKKGAQHAHENQQDR